MIARPEGACPLPLSTVLQRGRASPVNLFGCRGRGTICGLQMRPELISNVYVYARWLESGLRASS